MCWTVEELKKQTTWLNTFVGFFMWNQFFHISIRNMAHVQESLKVRLASYKVRSTYTTGSRI